MTNRKWIWRLAAGLSALWVLGAYFLTETSDTFRLFLIVGVLPILAGWIIYWVIAGFREDKQKESRRLRMRLTWWK